MQNYARRNKLPIDTVGYDFVMMGTDPEAYKEPPPEVRGVWRKGRK